MVVGNGATAVGNHCPELTRKKCLSEVRATDASLLPTLVGHGDKLVCIRPKSLCLGVLPVEPQHGTGNSTDCRSPSPEHFSSQP